MQRVMQIYSPHEKKLIQMSWLSSAAYEDGKGYVSLRFDPALKPYLLQLKNQFTKIDVADTLKFKSIYAVRIFELLSQYTSIGKREISVEDLRSYCGIKEQEYALYSDLKRKVINRAKTEINAKTEYDIDYKELKYSRKISSIDWTIQKKTHFEKMQSGKALLLSTELQSKHALIEQMLEYGYTRQVANRILKNHEETDIANALKAVDIYRSRHDVKNPKALVYSAIKEQWHPDKFVSKNSA
jgi:plasmid replication initiation protein